MKKKSLLAACLLLAICPFLRAQEPASTDSITVSYETPSLKEELLRDLMEFQGIQCIDVTVKSTCPITYTLYQVQNAQGEEKRKSIGLPFGKSPANELTFRFFSQVLSSDTVRIRIARPISTSFKVPLPTSGCILMETISDVPYALTDRIPLIAYTPGHQGEVEINGMKGTFIDYCSVRDAHKHPSEWHELFNIGNYIYFELEIQSNTTPQYNFKELDSESDKK